MSFNIDRYMDTYFDRMDQIGRSVEEAARRSTIKEKLHKFDISAF